MEIIEPIAELHERIKHKGSKIILFGESLCDLHLTKTAPLYYNIATPLSSGEIQEALALTITSPVRIFSIFHNKHKFEHLRGDFLPKGLQHPISINIHCETEDFSAQRLSIQRCFWDFKDFHNIEQVEREFSQEKLTISESLSEFLSKDSTALTEYTRYRTNYKLEKSPHIKLTKGLPQRNTWRQEFFKILLSEKPSEIFEELRQNGVLMRELPELLEGYQITQNEHHKYDIYYHSLYSCDAAPRENLPIRLAALLHDIGKARAKKEIHTSTKPSKSVFYNHENIGARMSKGILKRLGFNKENRERITELVRLHMFHYTADWTDNAIRRFIRNTAAHFDDLIILREADRIGSGKRQGLSPAVDKLSKRIAEISAKDKAPKTTDLKINGHALIEKFSLREGPIIGKILQHLLNYTIQDPQKNTEAALFAEAKQWLKNKNKAATQL